MFANSSFVNKMAALQKRHKHSFRIQWHAKKHVFWETHKHDYITKRKNKNTFICHRCKQVQHNMGAFSEDCKKGCCVPTTQFEQSQNQRHNQRKLHMFENFKALAANIRGINACGKRQILSAKWEREGIDAALLSEVQKTQGEWKKKDSGGSTRCFIAQV